MPDRSPEQPGTPAPASDDPDLTSLTVGDEPSDGGWLPEEDLSQALSPTAPAAPDGAHDPTSASAAAPVAPSRRRPRPTPAPMPGEDPAEPTATRLTRRLLGTSTMLLDATPRARLLGWAGPLAVALLGGVLRFWNLGRPHHLVFDETYYVKNAYSLLVRGYEAGWGADPNPAFEAGDTSGLGVLAEYVVHPPVGKWLIAFGIHLGGGQTSAVAWRLAVAVAGTLAVLMLARVARRLLASTALGTLAGLFLAVDGMAIVMSRTSLLDPFLMVFALGAFGLLLLDREQARRRLAVRTAAILDAGQTLPAMGPMLGVRWWRLGAAVLLGLACGTKWSGIYFLAVLGVLSVLWDVTARRTVGVRRWFVGGVVRDGLVAGVAMVGIAAATYVATWTSWFASEDAWGRRWAEQHPGEGVTWLPPALRSLWQYHLQMWTFHSNLDTPHPYEAHPLGWVVQWRPTSFYYPSEVSGLRGAEAQEACGANLCSQAITSLGNPLIWWLGAAGLLVALVWLVLYRDWRASAVLSGVVAGWLPWMLYTHRTIFTFYSIAFLPWVVLALTYTIGLLIGPKEAMDPATRKTTIRAVAVVVLLVVAVSAFFYPVWTAWVIPYDHWRLRMWLPSWV